MDVDWGLVARHAFWYSGVAGGISTVAVLGTAVWIEFPLGLAALGLAMVAVGALISQLRSGSLAPSPRSLVSGTRSSPTTTTDDGPPARTDRELIYFLSGLLAFSLLTVIARLLAVV